MFGTFLTKYDNKVWPVPPRCHQKNRIEPNNCAICSIFLRLKASDDTVSDIIFTIRSFRISNNFYGSNTLSSFEMAKDFSKPVLENQRPNDAYEVLQSDHD